MARSREDLHPKLQDIPPYQLKKSKKYKVRKQVHSTTSFGKMRKMNLPAGPPKKGLSATDAAAEIEKIRKESGGKFGKQVKAVVIEE